MGKNAINKQGYAVLFVTAINIALDGGDVYLSMHGRSVNQWIPFFRHLMVYVLTVQAGFYLGKSYARENDLLSLLKREMKVFNQYYAAKGMIDA